MFKRIKKELKRLNLSEKAIILGIIFGTTLGITLHSFALAISLGIIFIFVFNEEEKKNKK